MSQEYSWLQDQNLAQLCGFVALSWIQISSSPPFLQFVSAPGTDKK